MTYDLDDRWHDDRDEARDAAWDDAGTYRWVAGRRCDVADLPSGDEIA